MRIWKSITTAALLWGSFLLSHEIAYRLAYPTAVERAHELAHSGHGWLNSTIHYGVPAIAAVLILGLFLKSESASQKHLGFFGFGSAGMFAGVEVLERYVSSFAVNSHGFTLNSTVMSTGIMLAFLTGMLISGIYFTVRTYTLNSIYLSKLAVPVMSSPNVLTSQFADIKALITLAHIRLTPMRGPPQGVLVSH